MDLLNNQGYLSDIKKICSLPLPWDKMSGKSVLITGASGMIGSCLVDTLMQKNIQDDLNCKVIAVGRNIERARERFGYCYDSDLFTFLSHNINCPLSLEESVGYVLHLASNTHPIAYATDPIGTITTNIIGTNNLLQFAVENGAERFLFTSSVEVYGENRGDVEKFDESYLGYLDCNTLRAGYPESKRCGEALCQAYRKQYGLDVVIPRLSRVYGVTMLSSDSKASAQFIRNGAAGKDIILKSKGTQLYSYTYVTDIVSALLTLLLKGADGEAYNVADERSDTTLRNFAQSVADIAGTKVIFDVPSDTEKLGSGITTKARLDTVKLCSLGWQAKVGLHEGIRKTVEWLREID